MYMYMRLYIFAHKTEGLENEPTLYTYGCMHFRSRSAGVRQIHEHVYVRTRIICPTFKLANGSTTTIRQLRSLKISQSMLFLFPPSLVYTYECSQSASVCLSACSTFVCLRPFCVALSKFQVAASKFVLFCCFSPLRVLYLQQVLEFNPLSYRIRQVRLVVLSKVAILEGTPSALCT